MKSTRGLIFVACTIGALVVLAGCRAPKGRIKDPDEGSLVGARTAGAATYNQLVANTTAKLLETHAKRRSYPGKMLICFVGVENKSAEELGANKEALYESIDTVIVNSGIYHNISKRFVDAALRETGIRTEQIFLAAGRQSFMSVLGREGLTPDYLLWGKLTTLSTAGSKVREREYQLTMEMVDANSGLIDAKETSKVTKEYLK